MVTPLVTIQLVFLVVNVAMAAWHAHLIKRHRPIRHGLWATLYLCLVLVPTFAQTVHYFLALLFLRAVFFSPALSLFRGLPITYISSSTTSVIDRIERNIFGRDWYLRTVVYALLLLAAEYPLLRWYSA